MEAAAAQLSVEPLAAPMTRINVSSRIAEGRCRCTHCRDLHLLCAVLLQILLSARLASSSRLARASAAAGTGLVVPTSAPKTNKKCVRTRRSSTPRPASQRKVSHLQETRGFIFSLQRGPVSSMHFCSLHSIASVGFFYDRYF